MNCCYRVLIFLFAILGIYGQDTIYKMCVTERQATSNDCNILQRAGSQVNCINVIDYTDCALKLEKGEADFGMFTPEEAILTSLFDKNQERKVVAEIRDVERSQEPFQFETVAVVKREFSGSFRDLKGKNFCHPGFSKSQLWTDRVLKHFERVIINKTGNGNKCDKAMRTAEEDELSALSSFFSKACRPGQWVASEYDDKRFKERQYSNLCALCDSPSGCSYNQQKDGNQYSSLECLTKKGGDVTYASLFYVKHYFGNTSANHAVRNQYKYLCPDETTQDISTEDPCKWIKQPWFSIVARNNDIAEKLRNGLPQWIPTEHLTRKSADWTDTLTNIIGKVYIPNHVIDLRTYIEKGREIPTPRSILPCHSPIRWCTTSQTEIKKCEWLKQAALVQGIVPDVECVAGISYPMCFNLIQREQADIIGIDSTLGTVASHYYNLTTSFFQETEKVGRMNIIAVIKSNTAVLNMKKLEKKKACFPEFGGLAWTAFADVIKDTYDSKLCPFDSSMSSFFTSICAPGAKERLGSNNTFCNLCTEISKNSSNNIPVSPEVSCETSYRNKLYGDVGALICLGSGKADVAFINAYHLESILDSNSLPQDFNQKHSILCRNGTTHSLTTAVDENCAIVAVTGGEVVARGKRSRVESRDLFLTLLKLDEWFGYVNSHFETIFNIYEAFDGTKDLLFRKETLGLITIRENDEDPSIKIYSDLKNNAEKCYHPNKSGGAQGVKVKITLPILLFIITTRMHIFN